MVIPSKLKELLKLPKFLVTASDRIYNEKGEVVKKKKRVIPNAHNVNPRNLYVVNRGDYVANAMYVQASEDGRYMDIYIVGASTSVGPVKNEKLGIHVDPGFRGYTCGLRFAGIRIFKNKKYTYLLIDGDGKIYANRVAGKFLSRQSGTYAEADMVTEPSDDMESPSKRKIPYYIFSGITDLRTGYLVAVKQLARRTSKYELSAESIKEVRKVFPEGSRYAVHPSGKNYPLKYTSDITDMLNGPNRTINKNTADKYDEYIKQSDSVTEDYTCSRGGVLHRHGDRLFHTRGRGSFDLFILGKKNKNSHLCFSYGTKSVPQAYGYRGCIKCTDLDVFDGTLAETVLADDNIRQALSKTVDGELWVNECVLKLLSEPYSSMCEQLVKLGLSNIALAVLSGLISKEDSWHYGEVLEVMRKSTSVIKSLGMNVEQLKILDRSLEISYNSQPQITQRYNTYYDPYSSDITYMVRSFNSTMTQYLGSIRRLLGYEKWNVVEKETLNEILTFLSNRRSSRLIMALESIKQIRNEENARISDVKKVLEYCSESSGDMYADYLSTVRCARWYGEVDMHEFPLFVPVDEVRAYHDRAVNKYNELSRWSEETRVKKLDDAYGKILPKVQVYEYSEDKYSIIAPKSLAELTEEGNALHHCVGSYKSSVAAGNEYILFMRKNDNVKTPWITVNITPDGSIRQIHGACNSNLEDMNEKDDIIKFLGNWADKAPVNKETLNTRYGLKCHM